MPGLIAKFIWGKWRGEVHQHDRFTVALKVMVVGEEMKGFTYTTCKMEAMYRMFPPRASTGNLAIDWLIQYMDPEKTMLDKWVDFQVPILIERGIKAGLWSK